MQIGKVFHPNKPKANDQNYSWSEPYGSTGGGQCRKFTGPVHHPSNFACDENYTSITNPRIADNAVANWALRKLAQLDATNATASYGKPFFVAAGIHKPHLYVQKSDGACLSRDGACLSCDHAAKST